MNRIYELAKEADEYADAMDIGGKNYIGLRDVHFARLIIQECASVAKETRWAVPPSQEQIARSIKEHFGVD